MVIETRSPAPGTSLTSLVKGFLLTKQVEGRSPKTIAHYSGHLRRFLWYAERNSFPDDIALLTEWHIKEFLHYIATAENG